MYRRTIFPSAASFLALLLQVTTVSANIMYAYCPGVILDSISDLAKLVVATNRANKDVFGVKGDFKLIAHTFPASEVAEEDALYDDSDGRRLEVEIETAQKQIASFRNNTGSAITQQRRLPPNCNSECDCCNTDCTFCGEGSGCCDPTCGSRRNLRAEGRDLLTEAEYDLFQQALWDWLDRVQLYELVDCAFEMG